MARNTSNADAQAEAARQTRAPLNAWQFPRHDPSMEHAEQGRLLGALQSGQITALAALADPALATIASAATMLPAAAAAASASESEGVSLPALPPESVDDIAPSPLQAQSGGTPSISPAGVQETPSLNAPSSVPAAGIIPPSVLRSSNMAGAGGSVSQEATPAMPPAQAMPQPTLPLSDAETGVGNRPSASAPQMEPTRNPVPDAVPNPGTNPVADPVPNPLPNPAPNPIPNPTPVPNPLPVPNPIPNPVPNPLPNPVPNPIPNPIPNPVPNPLPNPVPNPIPNPIPNPVPNPIPNPTPNPVPAPPVAPVLTLPPCFGHEDQPMTVSVGLGALGAGESAEITLSGLPAGGTLSAGMPNPDGSWTLNPAELVNLTFTPPANWSGLVQADVSVTVTNADGATTTTGTIAIGLEGVADAPDLLVHAALGLEDGLIPLSITAALADTDGSETLSLRIDNVPAGATLSAGTHLGVAPGCWRRAIWPV